MHYKSGVLYAACIISTVATATQRPPPLRFHFLCEYFILVEIYCEFYRYHSITMYMLRARARREEFTRQSAPAGGEQKAQHRMTIFRAFLIKTFSHSPPMVHARNVSFCAVIAFDWSSNAFHACLDLVPIAHSSPLSCSRRGDERNTALKKVSYTARMAAAKHLNPTHTWTTSREKVYRFLDVCIYKVCYHAGLRQKNSWYIKGTTKNEIISKVVLRFHIFLRYFTTLCGQWT